jgi:HSP20 family protein
MALSLWNDDFFLRPFEELIPSRSFSNSSNLTKDFMPLMGTDLIESETNYSVNVDLPGVDPEKDLEITVTEDNCLTMKAERKFSHEEKTDKVRSMERSFGTVKRKIRLPKNVDLDGCHTNFKNGVLIITIPKKMDMKSGSRKLSIKYE